MGLIFVITTIVILNTLVSVHVVIDGRRLRNEKVAEIGLVWILPLIGMLISLAISFDNPARIREFNDIERFFRTT